VAVGFLVVERSPFADERPDDKVGIDTRDWAGNFYLYSAGMNFWIAESVLPCNLYSLCFALSSLEYPCGLRRR